MVTDSANTCDNWTFYLSSSTSSYPVYIYVGQQRAEPEIPKPIRRRRVPRILTKGHIIIENHAIEHDKKYNVNRNKNLTADKRWKTKKGLWRYKLKK